MRTPFSRSLRFLFASLSISCLSSVIYFNILVVPDGNIGLLKERTEGWSKGYLSPGYHWIWTAFVPLKWKLHLIDVDPPAVRISFKASLRYTDYLQLSDIFRIQIQIRAGYRLKQENIYRLMGSVNENIDKLDEYVKERVSILLELKHLEFYRSDADIPALKARFTRYIQATDRGDSFASDWKKIFQQDGIELLKFNLVKLYIPDSSLYRTQLQNLGELVNARRKALLKNIDAEANAYAFKINNEVQLKKVERVLKLIGHDSRILEYLKYQDLNPKTSVIRIESEKQITSQNPLRFQAQNQQNGTDNGDDTSGISGSENIREEVGQIGPITR